MCRAALVLVALLVFAPAARADTFSLQHYHSGALDAEAQGDVTFPDAGGAVVNVTVSDRNEDGWCGDAWVRSNLPPATHKLFQVCGVAKQQTFTVALPATARCNITFVEVQVGRVDPSNGSFWAANEYATRRFSDYQSLANWGTWIANAVVTLQPIVTPVGLPSPGPAPTQLPSRAPSRTPRTDVLDVQTDPRKFVS